MTCRLTHKLPGRRRYEEAREQLEDTRREVARVQRQWALVHEIVETFTRHRERNHFSESIANIYRGGRP